MPGFRIAPNDTTDQTRQREPKLVRVVAPHFVAGIEFANGKCTETAPILAWAKGKTEEELRAYFKTKGWHASIIAAAEGAARREREPS